MLFAGLIQANFTAIHKMIKYKFLYILLLYLFAYIFKRSQLRMEYILNIIVAYGVQQGAIQYK